MVDPTPHWGIHRWDDTAPAAPLEDFFNTQADDLEAALDGAATGWFLAYATKAAMDAVPGTKVGQHATVNADSVAQNNGDYKWSGSAWITNNATLNKAPDTVLFGTLPPEGARLIKFAGVTSVDTVATGDAHFLYPSAFPNGVISVHLQRFNFSTYQVTTEILNTIQALNQCNFRIYGSTGSPLASVTGVKYAYDAIGW